jgi:hypothetical protein
MTQNWTNIPIYPCLNIRKVYITELWHAYRERVLCFLTDDFTGSYDSNSTDPGEIYFDTDGLKVWGAAYPKTAEYCTSDNAVKRDHILAARYGAIGTQGSGQGSVTSGEYYKYAGFDYDTYRYFINMESGDYLVYQTLAEFLTAVGLSDWTDKEFYVGLDPIIRTLKSAHINEIRSCYENLIWMTRLATQAAEYRQKSYTSGFFATADLAWADAKTGFAAAAWGAWTATTHYQLNPQGQCYIERGTGGDSGKYKARFYGREKRQPFNTDIEIAGMDWTLSPSLAGKLCVFGYRLQDTAGNRISDGTGDGFFGKLIENGDTADVLEDDAPDPPLSSQYYGTAQILSNDIADYLGSATQTYTISSKNEFSGDDFDLIRPDAPSVDGNQNQNTIYLAANYVAGQHIAWIDGMSTGDPLWGYGRNMIYPIIKPDWHYGTDDGT